MRGTKNNSAETGDLLPENLNGIYREIATLLDCETALILHDAFRGQQVTFPVKVLSREYVGKKIRLEYNGANLKDLATKYGYTEKWLRRILSEETN